MVSIVARGVSARAERMLAQLHGQRRSSLYANAYALVLNQVASAGLGVLYWMVAARSIQRT